MPCERCVNRRVFIAAAAGVAGLSVIASCGDGLVSGVGTIVDTTAPGGGGGGGGGGQTVVITVANFPGLAQDEVLVQVSSFFAAKRTGPASFEAFSMACTHEGCLLEITNGQQFDCPCHFSRFAKDGSVVQGPATRSLQRLNTSYDPATDQLTIG
jgi:Rieske Fe-S protein